MSEQDMKNLIVTYRNMSKKLEQFSVVLDASAHKLESHLNSVAEHRQERIE